MMSQQRFLTSSAPDIFIEDIGGNLQIKGWNQSEVLLQADPHSLRVEVGEDQLRISCDANCDIRLPSGSSVKIGKIMGEAGLRLLEDPVDIEEVHGSLRVRDMADIRVETVHGEFWAKRIAGNLQVETVHGNVVARNVQGQCALTNVHGNIDIHNIESDIVTSTQGNARIRLAKLGGKNYNFDVEGNVHCRLPQNAGLKLRLTSEAESITIRLADGTQVFKQEKYEVNIGSGEVPFNLAAGGSIYLSARDSGSEEDEDHDVEFEAFTGLPDDFGDQIARQVEVQIEAQMEALNQQLNERMSTLTLTLGRSALTPEETERIMRRAQESSERATVRAQEKMRRAQEKLEHKLEAARRREEQRSRVAERWTAKPSWSAPPAPPTAPTTDPVSDEERVMILHMLEQKKITLAEAEQLLESLEGTSQKA